MPSRPPKAIVRVPPGRVRRRAVKIIAVGAIIAVAWTAVVLVFFADWGRTLWGPGLGAPAVPLLVGLVELVSGRSFAELAQSWDDLAGWQRGILGLVIVARAVLAVMVAAGIAIAASK